MKLLSLGALAACLAAGSFSVAQFPAHRSADRERLIGAWHLVRIDAPGEGKQVPAGPQPSGMLIYSRDGHVSVQLMYPAAQHDLNNQYVRSGYEASFGTFEINEATHTLTHHIQGANTGELLVGKDLPRTYQFTNDGHLIIRPAQSGEHWSVEWQHY